MIRFLSVGILLSSHLMAVYPDSVSELVCSAKDRSYGVRIERWYGQGIGQNNLNAIVTNANGDKLADYKVNIGNFGLAYVDAETGGTKLYIRGSDSIDKVFFSAVLEDGTLLQDDNMDCR